MTILLEDDFFIFWKEQGIIGFRYKKKIVTIEIARHGVETRTRLTNNSKCLIYADLTNIKSITKEARDFYATYEAGRLVHACAVFTPSLLAHTLVVFFLNFNKPDMPFKAFSSKDNAIQWLLEMNLEPVLLDEKDGD